MRRSQSSSSSIIGLCLGDTDTQAVELSPDGLNPTLRAIAEWRGGMKDNPGSTVERLMAFIAANDAIATRIAVTLDMDSLFTHVFPVPAGQAGTLLQKHARWDLAQFFPDVPESEFITDVHLLDTHGAGVSNRALCVAVRRSLARALQEAIEEEHLELHILDGCHFSAEHYLTARHPEGTAGTIVLIGLKQDRMDLSVLMEGALVDYAARNDSAPESCVAEIAEIRRNHGEVRKVFLYGPRATPAAAAGVRAGTQLIVEVLNPFAGMDVAPRNPVAAHLLSMAHRFVPAVGAALREE